MTTAGDPRQHDAGGTSIGGPVNVPLEAVSLQYAYGLYPPPFKHRRYLLKGSAVVGITGGLRRSGGTPRQRPGTTEASRAAGGGKPVRKSQSRARSCTCASAPCSSRPDPAACTEPWRGCEPPGTPARSCPRASTGQAAAAGERAQHWGSTAAAGTALFPIQTRGSRCCGAGPSPASVCKVRRVTHGGALV